MSPHISRASPLSRGHLGCKGVWENGHLATGKVVIMTDASRKQERGITAAGRRAMSAVAVFQAIHSTPLLCLLRASGNWGWGGHARFQHGTGGDNGRPPSSGTQVGPSPCPHSPARAPALPARLIRQPGANVDNTPGSPAPFSLGANTPRLLVSWIPRRGQGAKKHIH